MKKKRIREKWRSQRDQTDCEVRVVHRTRRHLERVGATTVLEVTVTYPELEMVLPGDEIEASPQESSPERSPAPTYFVDVSTLNDTYRTLAETYLTWAKSEPAKQASEDFFAAGKDAAYTFDRRLLTCRMEATVISRGKGATATRVLVRCRVSRSTRRSSQPTWQGEDTVVWQVRGRPEGAEGQA